MLDPLLAGAAAFLCIVFLVMAVLMVFRRWQQRPSTAARRPTASLRTAENGGHVAAASPATASKVQLYSAHPVYEYRNEDNLLVADIMDG